MYHLESGEREIEFPVRVYFSWSSSKREDAQVTKDRIKDDYPNDNQSICNYLIKKLDVLMCNVTEGKLRNLDNEHY